MWRRSFFSNPAMALQAINNTRGVKESRWVSFFSFWMAQLVFTRFVDKRRA
jgi:hypothetical protein